MNGEVKDVGKMLRELLDAYGIFYEEELGNVTVHQVLDVIKEMIRS